MAAASALKAAAKASVRSSVEASAMQTAYSAATHAASSATNHAASEITVHTSPEAGLAAEGVLVCHAAVVESAECAGVTASLHVRRSKATIGSMVEVILVAPEIVAVEIAAVGESVVVVEKSM